MVDDDGHKAAGGLPVVRVAQALIKAPIEEVALCWWQAGRRKVKRAVLSSRHPLVVRPIGGTFLLVVRVEGVLHRLDTLCVICTGCQSDNTM